jgi:flavin-dependent dehydrogenase
VGWDVAVAGGGPAGAAAACHLARAGRRVVLLERERHPHHKVCGEFVSVEAGRHLASLGGRALLGEAARIERVRLVHGRTEAAAALPFPAWGLSRRRLDAWLLDQAEREGVAVRRGRLARALATDGAGARLETAGGPVVAGAALLATGKHELRGRRRRSRGSDLIGLKLHLGLAEAQRRALAGHVELVLFGGGYAGLQLVEDGVANLCLLVGKGRFAELGRDWRRLVLSVPHLARRLDGAEACWPRPLAIHGMPYGYLHEADDGGNVYRVGDQVAVIPSFTGDGMAMALHSGAAAARAILAGRPPAAFHLEVAEAFRRSVRLATLVSSAASRPWLQGAFAAVCRLAPGLMGVIASRTRVRPRWPGLAEIAHRASEA